MNTSTTNQFREQALQDQFGSKIAARLSQASAEVPHDISERLRVARQQAVAQRKKPQLVLASHVNVQNGAATLNFGNERIGLWGRFASILPLIALLVGLIAINIIQDDDRANELAEVDSALLTDDLPPSAYTDPGFTQFLRVSKEQAQ
jgi:hypothetical protein